MYYDLKNNGYAKKDKQIDSPVSMSSNSNSNSSSNSNSGYH